MRVSRWIPKAANTQSKYVTLSAFPLHQWLHECASVSVIVYVRCLSWFYFLRIRFKYLLRTCSATSSAYVLQLVGEVLHPTYNSSQNCSSACFNLPVFRSKTGIQKIPKELLQPSPEFNLFVIDLCIQFRFVSLVPKFLNFSYIHNIYWIFLKILY